MQAHAQPSTRRSEPPVDKVTLLAGVHLFARSQRTDLIVLARRSDVVIIPASTELCRTGQRGQALYVIVDGEVSATSPTGVRQLTTHEAIGQLALVSDAPHRSTVTSTRNTIALRLTVAEFRSVMRDLPQLASGVLATLAADVIDADLLEYFH